MDGPKGIESIENSRTLLRRADHHGMHPVPVRCKWNFQILVPDHGRI